MKWHHPNLLAYLRKKSGLTQGDFSVLQGIEDTTAISKCECGDRSPNLKLILHYCIVLDESLEKVFEDQTRIVENDLRMRIPALVDRISSEPLSVRREKRLKHLVETINRLNMSIYE